MAIGIPAFAPVVLAGPSRYNDYLGIGAGYIVGTRCPTNVARANNGGIERVLA